MVASCISNSKNWWSATYKNERRRKIPARSVSSLSVSCDFFSRMNNLRKKLRRASCADNNKGGDPIEEEAETATTARTETGKRSQKLKSWNPVRLSGRIRFQKSSSTGIERLDDDASGNKVFTRTDPYALNSTDERVNPDACGYQFHNYCQHTSLHGFRYITEKHRNFSERIFWIGWCLFGISSAIYMMSKIWQKWQDNPVLTSIATTNLPVSEINFPAVTICPVNKAISEKLIIQGCRHNLSYSTMRKILSGLVDVDSRNNDNDPRISDSVDAKIAMKYLRLVSPKCEDYILRCELNGQKPPCTELFKLVLTDSGYCCTFNALDADSKIVVDSRNMSDVVRQELEFEYLQKAVWQYHDKFRKIFGNPDEANQTKLPTDSLTCSRIYDDDLFPGICHHIAKCRADPGACKLNATVPPSKVARPKVRPAGELNVGRGGRPFAPAPKKNNGTSTLFRAPGAGRSRGLSIMTDTLRCGDVPTDSFKGLRVYVHGADEFPAVGEKGFIVAPGKETQIGVTAIDAYSADALWIFKRENRQCVFRKEMKLSYYKEYSRSACVIECEDYLVHKECNCVPYYSPAAGNYSICSMRKMLDCVQSTLDEIQRRVTKDSNGAKQEERGPGSSLFSFDEARSKNEKSCVDICLPACNETFYNIVVTSATFPNQNDPNKTKLLREAIDAGFENLADINYVSGSISLLRVFFRESTIMQYKRDELFTWEDFISNLGGVMSLCLGFSLLSLIEVIYFFTMRQIIDRRKRSRRMHEQMDGVIVPSIYVTKTGQGSSGNNNVGSSLFYLK